MTIVQSYPVKDKDGSCLGQTRINLNTLLRTEAKYHTLSSGTSPYRPYKGVPPPPPHWESFTFVLPTGIELLAYVQHHLPVTL